MLGAGASRVGFYRIQMLEVINRDYFIVPIVLTVGGVLTLIVAVCGMMAAIRDGPKLLIAYSVLLALSIIISIGCIGCCVLLLFDIQAGFLSVDAVHAELSTYSSDSSVQHRWDTMQRELWCLWGCALACLIIQLFPKMN